MQFRRLALWALAVTLFAPTTFAQSTRLQAGSATEQIEQQKRSALAPNHRKLLEQRSNSKSRFERGNMYVYADPEGSQTFTNIPEKYNRKRGYKQIEVEKIKFEPVKVAPKFTRHRAPSSYKSTEYAELITESATRYGLDEDLIYAVIRAESAFNPLAVSSAGACGLMQLMPGTAAEMGVTDIYDAAQNIDGGSQYLAKMLGLFGDAQYALAAYNAGPERVRTSNGIPPIPETRKYVNKVVEYWTQLKGGSVTKDALLQGASSKIRLANYKPSMPKASGKVYMVKFHSGLSQPADKVEDKDPYYVIEYNQRQYYVRKDLVANILEPA